MSETCDTAPVRHGTALQGPLRFELWVARQLCLQQRQSGATDLTSGALSVRVINEGATPVILVAAATEAVAIERISDGDVEGSAIEVNPGPEPEEVPTVQVEIPAGMAWDSAPVENYLSFAVPDLLAGERLDGSALPDELKRRRIFRLDANFAANANTGAGFRPVSQRLTGFIEAVVLPPQP